MQITVKHIFQSAKADSADGTLVQPSHWNQDHFVDAISDVSSVFGRTGAVVAQNGDYNASQVTNAVSTLGSYNDPPWINSLSWSKIQGVPATGVSSVFGRTGAVVATAGDYNASQVTNAANITLTYSDPPWITALSWNKITSPPNFIIDPLTTKGDLLVRSATVNSRLPVGANGLILMADSAQILGLRWGSPGAAFQSPWLSNIDGAGFSLSNALNIAITGTFVTTAKGNLFGSNGGPLTSLVSSDANIKLYEGTGGNWAGIGSDGGGDMWFRTGLSGTHDARMVIKASGNVGIGTVIPTSPLQISIDNNGAIDILRLDNITNIPDNGAMIVWTNANQPHAAGRIGFIRASSGTRQDLVFHLTSNWSLVEPNEKIRFTGDGRIGIGTTNPLSFLDITVPDAVLSRNVQIWRSYPGVETVLRAGSDAHTDFGSTTSHLLHLIANGARVMSIMPGGRVGIGNTNPSTNLDVVGATDGALNVRNSATGGSLIMGFNDGIGGGFIGSWGPSVWNTIRISGKDGEAVHIMNSLQNGYLYFGYGSGDNTGMIGSYHPGVGHRPININPAGSNVGIGEQAPKQALHVAGTGIAISNLGNPNYWRMVQNSDQTILQIGYYVSGAWYPTGNPALQIAFNGQIAMAYLPNANPGAGTKQLWYDPTDGNRVKFAA